MSHLKHYHKVSEDENVAILKHKDGHQVRIAKKALSHAERMKLHEMPRYFKDGGMAESFAPKDPFPEKASESPEWMQETHADPQVQSPTLEQHMPEQHAPTEDLPLAYKAGKVLSSMNMISNPLVKAGIGYMVKEPANQAINFAKGMVGTPVSQSQGSPQQSTPTATEPDQVDEGNMGSGNQGQMQQQQPMAQGQNQLAKSFLAYANGIGGEYTRMMQAYDEAKIDPKQVAPKLGFGEKMLNIFGSMLGGAGAAMAGQEPLFYKRMEEERKNAIHAQEKEMDKKKNILSEYTKFLEHGPGGKDMLGIIQLGTLSAMAKQRALKETNPLLQQHQFKLADAYHQQAVLASNGLANKMALEQQQTMQNVNMPEYLKYIPKELHKDMYKQKAEAQDTIKFSNRVWKAFQDIRKLNTLRNRAFSPIESKRLINSILEPILAELAKKDIGRYTHADAEALRPGFVGLFDSNANADKLESDLYQKLKGKENFPILDDWKVDIGVTPLYGYKSHRKIK